MFDCQQFRTYIIEPVLSRLQLYSKDAEELLVFTCAAETNGGQSFVQDAGPALGIYQCEPNTHTDIWINYIRQHNSLATLMAMHLGCTRIPAPERLVYDLWYATAMARIHYLRNKTNLPKADDVNELWAYYKEHYNTAGGAAQQAPTIKKYQKFANLVLPRVVKLDDPISPDVQSAQKD